MHNVEDVVTMAPRKPYTPPVLTVYGEVRKLTQSGSGGSSEGKASGSTVITQRPSDGRLKTNVTRVGTHPQGFGLYLFDYRVDISGLEPGRQFGVIAQEVRRIAPEAVVEMANGFLAVDYERLGIRRRMH
jgi:hypothetical protein